jgi:LmbE family N-acetylglucosaminyl deacetylase
MNILAIGAHPDDIEFGCGGALIKYSKRGDNIYLLVLTKGEIGAKPSIRMKEQERSAKFLKAKKVYQGIFPDTKIPVDKRLITTIENAMKDSKPDIIFFNYYNDIHQDHRAVAEGAISATRYVKKVLFYEVPTTEGFEPDVFVDIGDVLEDKLKLLKIYASQVNKTRVPHLTILESAKSCANFRGFQARVKYAEGFKALRLMLDT